MTTLAVLLASVASWSAAVVAQTVDDEQLLKDTEQQLARAWSQHDRAFIESLLAPAWSVTQADGTILTRSTVLGPFFDDVQCDSHVIDDVTVTLFGERGSNVSTPRTAAERMASRCGHRRHG